MVEHMILDHAILVRVQVPQPNFHLPMMTTLRNLPRMT